MTTRDVLSEPETRGQPAACRHEEITPAAACNRLLGESSGLRRVLEEVEVVAQTEVPVMILGETGVGKELVARAIHERSGRCRSPLVKVNCTAIPHELFESEFFGHLRGAFTGAVRSRIGRFELAHRGTLFLDEIGDLPPDVQPKLLRVLQEGEFEAVGDTRTRRADVRILGASNRDLEEMVNKGQFREDLYYRLFVFKIEVPPLREREGDIAILARHFFLQACSRFARTNIELSDEHIDTLSAHSWPGNIRELQNVIERAVIGAVNGYLHFEIPGVIRHEVISAAPADGEAHLGRGVVPEEELRRKERDNLIAALERSGGKIYGPGGAAEMLGIKPTTLCSRVKKHGIRRSSSFAADHAPMEPPDPPPAATSPHSTREVQPRPEALTSREHRVHGPELPEEGLAPQQVLETRFRCAMRTADKRVAEAKILIARSRQIQTQFFLRGVSSPPVSERFESGRAVAPPAPSLNGHTSRF